MLHWPVTRQVGALENESVAPCHAGPEHVSILSSQPDMGSTRKLDLVEQGVRSALTGCRPGLSADRVSGSHQDADPQRRRGNRPREREPSHCHSVGLSPVGLGSALLFCELLPGAREQPSCRCAGAARVNRGLSLRARDDEGARDPGTCGRQIGSGSAGWKGKPVLRDRV